MVTRKTERAKGRRKILPSAWRGVITKRHTGRERKKGGDRGYHSVLKLEEVLPGEK